jgi:hypothetical protein
MSFAGQYPPVRLCSSLPPARRRPGGLGYSGLATPCQSLSRGSRRASQVPGEPPLCLRRVLRPRRDRRHQALAVRRRGPRSDKDEGSPRVVLSGLNSTAWALAVYASSRPLPGRDARLASGRWPGSTGWACLPTGFLRKVSEEVIVTSLPPFPSLLGAISVHRLKVTSVQIKGPSTG